MGIADVPADHRYQMNRLYFRILFEGAKLSVLVQSFVHFRVFSSHHQKTPSVDGEFFGGLGGDRTHDQLLKRQLLYH